MLSVSRNVFVQSSIVIIIPSFVGTSLFKYTLDIFECFNLYFSIFFTKRYGFSLVLQAKVFNEHQTFKAMNRIYMLLFLSYLY